MVLTEIQRSSIDKALVARALDAYADVRHRQAITMHRRNRFSAAQRAHDESNRCKAMAQAVRDEIA